MQMSVLKPRIDMFSLKIIALITMLIDHMAVALLDDTGIFCEVLRYIGRLSMPIFVFALVEGYGYARNHIKTLSLLFLFGVISEIPFDMVRTNTLIDWTGQNAFFSLFIGYAMMMLLDWIRANEKIDNDYVKNILIVAVIVLAASLSILMRTDYSAYEILAIAAMYFYRTDILMGSMAVNLILVCSNLIEITSFLTTPLLLMYNGKKGKGMKYLFYVFYPLHLLILGLVRRYIFNN